MTTLKRNRTFQKYLKKSKSKGLFGMQSYQVLHDWVRRNKPREVLECGTGKSTIAMALAMKENGFGRITSMEEDVSWFDHAMNLLPPSLEEYVLIMRSDVVGYCGGYRYRATPERLYEMVFIDGPYSQPNFDYLWVVNFCNPEAIGIIDKRITTLRFLGTVLAMRGVLATKKLRNTPLRLLRLEEYSGDSTETG